MWREFFSTLPDTYEFAPPASPEALALVKAQLGVDLPDDLCSLLSETNGVKHVTKQEVFPVVWTVERLVKENLEYRANAEWIEMFGPFERFLFFAHVGADGIEFAYPVTDTGQIVQDQIVAWEPIENETTVKASSLRDYCEGWLTGRLTV